MLNPVSNHDVEINFGLNLVLDRLTVSIITKPQTTLSV